MEPPLAKLQQASTAVLLGFGLGMGALARASRFFVRLAARFAATTRRPAPRRTRARLTRVLSRAQARCTW